MGGILNPSNGSSPDPHHCNSAIVEAGLDILNRLPNELKISVIQQGILPRQPCPNNLFDTCLGPWACQKGSHPGFVEADNNAPTGKLAITPCSRLTSISQLWLEEGSKFFYKNHLLVFDGDEVQEGLNLPEIITYRHHICHLVVKQATRFTYSRTYIPGWDLPLQVSFTSLPNLCTLHLDLRAYAIRYRNVEYPIWEDYQNKLVDGAERLSCLRLKKLVLRGLCSGTKWGDEEHKDWIRGLFTPAMEEGVEIEFWDEDEDRRPEW